MLSRGKLNYPQKGIFLYRPRSQPTTLAYNLRPSPFRSFFGLFSSRTTLLFSVLLSALFEATKKEPQTGLPKSPVQGSFILCCRLKLFALFRVFSRLHRYPYFIKFPDIIHVLLNRSVRCKLTA